MEKFLLLLYFVIGLVVVIYDYHLNLKEEYKAAKEDGEVDDSVLIMYWVTMIILWPLKALQIMWNKIKGIKKGT